MPFDGTGIFTPPSPEYPVVAGTLIKAADWNTIVGDIATGLTNALCRDGQSSPTQNINWGGKKITNLAAASNAGDAVRWEQLFTSAPATFKQGNGTELLPSYTFSGDTSTGMWRPGAAQLAFSVSGVDRLTITTASVTPHLPVRAEDGTEAAPSFAFRLAANMGAYRIGAGDYGIAISGVKRFSLTAARLELTVPVRTPDGSQAAPAHSFASDNASGLFTPAVGAVGLAAGGVGLVQGTASGISYHRHAINVTGGSGAAYTLTPDPAITAYATGQSFIVNFHAANSAAATLQINGVAVPPTLVKLNPDGTFSNLAANDLGAGHRSRVTLISATEAWVENVDAGSMRLGPNTALAGVSMDVTGIPSWVKRITIHLNQVSLNGGASAMIQLGDSGGMEGAGYIAASGNGANAASWVVTTYGNGFGVAQTAAGSAVSGVLVLTPLNSANTWLLSGTLTNGVTTMIVCSGIKGLTATLDRFRITSSNGVDTFDSGSFNYILEG